jgi:biotin carboxyl carrier protein
VGSRGTAHPLQLTARVDGATHAVEVVELEPRRYRVTIDDAVHVVDACPLRPDSLSLLIDHRSYAVDVATDGDLHRVTLDGRTVEVRLVDTLRHGGLGAAGEEPSGPQEIRAMMPGKIVTVLVATGDEVHKDQGLLVVEAMKMENELKAPAAGVVREILVSPGQAVETGEVLARIE